MREQGIVESSDRVTLYYEEYGDDPPVILTYGLAGSTEMWAPNIEALARHCRLILCDARGHGRSSAPVEPWRYSLRRWVEDIRCVLDHLNIPRACIGGLSMGGGIATRFALSYPERTSALLVSNSGTALGMPGPLDSLHNFLKGIELAAAKGMDALATHALDTGRVCHGRDRIAPNVRADVGARLRELGARADAGRIYRDGFA